MERGELVSRVHTIVERSAQVVYELQVLEEEEKVREEVQGTERESQGEEKRSGDHDHVDGVKDSTLEPLSHGACADDVTLCNRRDHARYAHVVSVEVVIGVRVMQYHAIMNVVIGIRVVLCHHAINNFGFSTFLNFPLRVQILILLSSCSNSSSFPVAILCTLFEPRKHVI